MNSGCVFVKTSSDDVERCIQLLMDPTWRPTASNLLPVIIPQGLSLKRQWYLCDKIREFCSGNTKDLMCPKPKKAL